MTDVPCHSWVWPTVLSHAGIKFLQIGCNDASGHLRVPHAVLVGRPGRFASVVQLHAAIRLGPDPAPELAGKNYLAMIMTGDNQGPPSLAEVEQHPPATPRRTCPASASISARSTISPTRVAAENPELPVVRADMPDTWIHGWMSMPIESKTAHTIRPFEPALDVLDTQLRAWGLTTGNVAPALADAYEQSNLYSEHTFGPPGPMAGAWNSGTPRDLYGDAWRAAHDRGAYKAYEAVFDDKRAYAHKEAEIVNRELRHRGSTCSPNR